MSEMMTAGEVIRKHDGADNNGSTTYVDVLEGELLDRIAGELFVKYAAGFFDASVRGNEHPNIPRGVHEEKWAEVAYKEAASFIAVRRELGKAAGG